MDGREQRPSPADQAAPADQAPPADGAGLDPTDAAVPRAGGRAARRWWIAGLAIAVLVVVLLAPLASPDPDGLERVAEDQGFIDRAENLVGGLLSDYAIPGIDDPVVSTVVSGLLGLAIVVLAIVVLGRLLARRRV